MQLLGIGEAGTHSAVLAFNDVADGLKYPIISSNGKPRRKVVTVTD